MITVGFAVPGFVPKAHAFHSSANISVSGFVLRSYYDPYLGSTVDAVKAASTLTFNVVIVASSSSFQRNISIGVKFDWMNQYQNATNASPQNTYALKANQLAYLSVAVSIPDLTGQYSGLNQVTHSWTLQVWSTSASQPFYTGFCPVDFGTTGCVQFSNSSFFCFSGCFGPVAVYSSAQANGVLTRQQASVAINALQTSLRSVLQAPPGTNAAVALLAQASEQLSLGDQAYQTGDFNTAQTDYQNSLNSANAAQSSLSITGGGTDTATMTRIWLEGVAALLGGISAILVGFAGFKYLRGRTTALSGSVPASPVK